MEYLVVSIVRASAFIGVAPLARIECSMSGLVNFARANFFYKMTQAFATRIRTLIVLDPALSRGPRSLLFRS